MNKKDLKLFKNKLKEIEKHKIIISKE